MIMKRIVYSPVTGRVKVEEVEAEKPRLTYRECNEKIELEVVVPREKEEDVLNSLKGNLPDDVLIALGIPVEDEDLFELCSELRSLGYACDVEVEENEDYCEKMEVLLSKDKESGRTKREMTKIIIEDGSIKIKKVRSETSYFLYEREGNSTHIEVVIEKERATEVYEKGTSLDALLSIFLPGCSADVERPKEVIECLERTNEYMVQVTRSEDYYQLYVEK